MDRFIGALVDRDLRIRIREGNPKSLDEAISRAVQLEPIYEGENGHKKQPVHVQTVHTNEASAEDRITAMLTRQTAVLESMVNLIYPRAGQAKFKLSGKSKAALGKRVVVGASGQAPAN